MHTRRALAVSALFTSEACGHAQPRHSAEERALALTLDLSESLATSPIDDAPRSLGDNDAPEQFDRLWLRAAPGPCISVESRWRTRPSESALVFETISDNGAVVHSMLVLVANSEPIPRHRTWAAGTRWWFFPHAWMRYEPTQNVVSEVRLQPPSRDAPQAFADRTSATLVRREGGAFIFAPPIELRARRWSIDLSRWFVRRSACESATILARH